MLGRDVDVLSRVALTSHTHTDILHTYITMKRRMEFIHTNKKNPKPKAQSPNKNNNNDDDDGGADKHKKQKQRHT